MIFLSPLTPNALRLFDHLIRPYQHVRRNRQTDLLRRLQVNHHLEFHGLLDGKIGGLGALEDSVDEAGRLAAEVQVVDAIRDEATGLGARAEVEEERQAVPGCVLDRKSVV